MQCAKLWLLEYVPDWFVKRGWMLMWYGDDDEDKFFECYNGCKKRKAQKANIKKEVLPIAWHPLRYWDWCIPENEK